MTGKLLTISIAAYNVEAFIEQALSSVCVPEIIDRLEIFVVDDGGTDGTLDIARRFAERYPASVFLVHKENGGYGSTVNYSLAHATGKDCCDDTGQAVVLHHNVDLTISRHSNDAFDQFPNGCFIRTGPKAKQYCQQQNTAEGHKKADAFDLILTIQFVYIILLQF